MSDISNRLTLNYKYQFLAIMYFCLFLVFVGQIIDNSQRIPLFVFIVTLLILFFVSKSARNIPYFLAALMLNGALLEGSFMFLSIRRIILIICLLYFIFDIVNRRTNKCMVPVLFYVIWLVYLAVNLLFINSGGTFQSVLTITYMFSASILLQKCVRESVRTSEKMILAISVGLSFIMIIAYVELIIGKTFFYSQWVGEERYRNGIIRVGSTVSDPNNVCFFLVPFIFLLETSSFKKTLPSYYRQAIKWPSIVLIFLTSSRAGIIALCAGVVIYLISKRKIYLVLAVFVAFLVYDYLLFIYNSILGQYEESTNLRAYIVEQAFNIWNNNILFGIGPTNIIPTIGYESNSLNTMNTYVYLLAGLGVIGLAFYIVYWIFILKGDISQWLKIGKIPNDTLLKITSVCTLLIIAYTLDTFYMMITWIMPAIFIAINKTSPVEYEVCIPTLRCRYAT